MKKVLVVLTILFVLAFVALPLRSWALTVSPPKFEFSADPGDVLTGKITLISTNDQSVTYYPTFERVEVKGSYGEPVFTGEQTGLASWITVPPQGVTVPPNEQRQTTFTIRVPEDAQPGGHYAAVFWGTKAPGGTGAVTISIRIAILILLNVSGDVIEQGEVFGFRADHKLNGYLPLNFRYKLENTGTVHLKPQGEIIIKNILGRTRAVINANSMGFNVLPNSSRNFSSAWYKTDEDEEKANKIQGSGFWANLKREKQGFGLGYYKAILNVKFGVKGQLTYQAKYGFWIFPWRLTLIGLIIFVIFLFLVWRGIRKYNQWIISKARG